MSSALTLALLVVTASGAAAGSSSARDGALPATADPGSADVPPGSPADRALWRRGYDLDNEIPIERSIASRLQLQAVNLRLVEALAAGAKRSGADPSAAERLANVERRLRAALRESVDLLRAQWPVDPTRVCGYAVLNFESVMRSDENPRKAAQLAETGAALRECVARGEAPLAVLRKANEELRSAIAAAVTLAGSGIAVGPAGCAGSLAGAVTGKFGCLATVITGDGGQRFFVITPKDVVAGVPTYQPGSFELPEPLGPGTRTLDSGLGPGMASVAADGGTLYTATKTSSQRGEVTLTLHSAQPDPERPGAFVVHGTYRARLLPAGGGKTGEILAEVSF
jgi:hypothetical protein